jgi:beta-glucanase (GH16 family)
MLSGLAMLTILGCTIAPKASSDSRSIDEDAAVAADAAVVADVVVAADVAPLPVDKSDSAAPDTRVLDAVDVPNAGDTLPARDGCCAPDAAPADVGGWYLDWADEFGGPSIDTTVWNVADELVMKNGELEYYRPGNAFIENGALVLEARQESYGGRDFTSGCLTSKDKKTFKYGRLTARIKLPATAGMWPAFWMLGATGAWPDGGELDIMESKGRVPTTVWGTAHWGPLTNGNHPNYGTTYQMPSGQDITGWHEYTLEWSAGILSWSVDGGHAYLSMVSHDPFNQQFYLILNLAVGGMFDDNVEPPRPMSPQRMLVDYVRVYQCCK